jgi:hypothetical protein
VNPPRGEGLKSAQRYPSSAKHVFALDSGAGFDEIGVADAADLIELPNPAEVSPSCGVLVSGSCVLQKVANRVRRIIPPHAQVCLGFRNSSSGFLARPCRFLSSPRPLFDLPEAGRTARSAGTVDALRPDPSGASRQGGKRQEKNSKRPLNFFLALPKGATPLGVAYRLAVIRWAEGTPAKEKLVPPLGGTPCVGGSCRRRRRDGSPKGGDAKRLRAQHDSPTPKGDAPNAFFLNYCC